METERPAKKRILFCPLDWGLGHASRDIYLIHKLLETGKFELILAADGGSYHLLKTSFPDLRLIRFPFMKITYSRHLPMALSVLLILPKLTASIRKEHHQLKTLIREHDIDIVISDNRFGLHNDSVTAVYITHQVRIRIPGSKHLLESMLYRWHLRVMNKFDHCWIPDFPGEDNLGGILSHPGVIPSNAMYVGPVSRFMQWDDREPRELLKHYEIVVILSGPEPQRTVLESTLIKKLRKSDKSILIVRGLPWDKQGQRLYDNIELVPHLPADLLRKYLLNASYIICRAGYSSIMDLAILGKTAILIPTPGQTEQEYLGSYLSEKGYFHLTQQKVPELDAVFKNYGHRQPAIPGINPEWLNMAIKKLQ